MNREQILELAKTEPKKDWRVYASMKHLLDEILTCEEYEQFIRELAAILEI